jgi:hypothetical protein
MWMAVEVELTQKSAERTREILAGYRAEHYARPSSGLWAVLYLTPDRRRAEHLKELGRRQQLGLDTTSPLQAQPLDAPAGLAATYRQMVTVHNVIQARQRDARAEARRRDENRIAAERVRRAAWQAAEERRRAEEQELADAAAERARRRFGGIFGGDPRSGRGAAAPSATRPRPRSGPAAQGGKEPQRERRRGWGAGTPGERRPPGHAHHSAPARRDRRRPRRPQRTVAHRPPGRRAPGDPRSSVYEYARRQIDPLPSITVGRHRRFYRSDVETWLASRRP